MFETRSPSPPQALSGLDAAPADGAEQPTGSAASATLPSQRDATSPDTTTETPTTSGTDTPGIDAPGIDAPGIDAPASETTAAVEDFATVLAGADATTVSDTPYAKVQAIKDLQRVANHCEGRLVQLTQQLHATYRHQLVLEDETLPDAVADLLDAAEAAEGVQAAEDVQTAEGAEGTAGDVGDVGVQVDQLAATDPEIAYWHAQIHKDATRMVSAEVAAAVGWSPREANWAVRSWIDWTQPADQLLIDAMTTGQLEVRKANVIAGGIAPMTNPDDQTRVCQLSLSRASALPRRRLEQLVTSLVDQLDPDAVEQRHANRVDERALVLEPGIDNTATLKTLGVPPDQAAAAYTRIDTLARRARTAGDDRTLNQLRCDLTIALLTGTAQFRPCDERDDETGNTTDTAPTDTAPTETAHAETALTSDRAPSWTFPLVPGETTGRAATVPDTVLTVPLETLLAWFGTPDDDAPRQVNPAATQTSAAEPVPAGTPPVDAERIGPLLDTIASRLLAARLDAAARGEGEWRLAITDKQGRVVQYHALHTRTLRGLRREAMAVDQQWCVFPTCTKPALRCEADHATAYARTRETRPANMEPLCAADHTVKTAGGYRIQRTNPDDPAISAGWQILMRSGHRYPTPNPVPPSIANPGPEPDHDPPPF